MKPHLLGLFLSLLTTKDVWEGFSQMYYDGSNESQIYELRCKATHIKQGGCPIPLYFVELKSIWQELDKRRPIKMICVADIKVHQEELVKDRVYEFLARLDDRFSKVRSDLLRMKPLPGFEESFAYVRREAQRQTIMLGSGRDVGDPSVAMVSKAPAIMAPCIPCPSVIENKDALHCTFCNAEQAARRPGHAKTADAGVRVVAVATSQSGATTPVLGNAGPVLSLISQLSFSDSPEDAGNLKRVLITSDVHDPGWIIDSGATDHVTYDKSLFQYVTTPHKNSVVTANGETTPMTGAGSVALTPSLSLHHNLLIPALSNHLLYDIQTREIIGRGTKRKGIYNIDDIALGRVHQWSW
ncbi:hypothetical protein F0562_007202 [Nyssa sinensis]|uniref:Retrovirus-related Pol polyprotein from transposon TNT 1-94-like beta-barrel domain-containing protein n=1 Tax=Nyssa sinensis TaxID=561372 RepID=A0A5J5A4J0_9ASTE|nr:hypothetical protein F0562_007202 [Nyssa sinensis]